MQSQPKTFSAFVNRTLTVVRAHKKENALLYLQKHDASLVPTDIHISPHVGAGTCVDEIVETTQGVFEIRMKTEQSRP